MNKTYDSKLIEIAQNLSKELKIDDRTHTGILTCLGGPNYETVAELRMWKLLGVDSVGMSIVSPNLNFHAREFNIFFKVHEATVARQGNMKVFAFSLITNKCITSYENDEEGEKLN